MKNCVLIDFDGTLTIRDTTRYLIIELLKIRPWRAYALLPFVVARFFRNEESVQERKNRAIAHLVCGLTDQQIEGPLQKFSGRIQPLLRQKIKDRIIEHSSNSVIVLVVTASPEFAIKASVSALPVNVIGTGFSMKEGIYLGSVDGEACFGSSKPRFIEEWCSRKGIEMSFMEAWSDSASDLPMMQMASNRFWVCPDINAASIRKLDPNGKLVNVATTVVSSESEYTPFLRWVFGLGCMVLIILALLPSDHLPAVELHFSWGDKALHAAAFAGLCLIGSWAYLRRSYSLMLGLLVLGGGIEIAQFATGWRHMSFGDFVANAVGIMIGRIAFLLLQKRRAILN